MSGDKYRQITRDETEKLRPLTWEAIYNDEKEQDEQEMLLWQERIYSCERVCGNAREVLRWPLDNPKRKGRG